MYELDRVAIIYQFSTSSFTQFGVSFLYALPQFAGARGAMHISINQRKLT